MVNRQWIESLPNGLKAGLRDPLYLSAIASVGLHGLMWIVLPLLPLQSAEPTEAAIQRPVELVELDAELQSRLPDFALAEQQQGMLPDIPQSTDLYSLPPFPNSPLPPLANTLPPPPLDSLPPFIPSFPPPAPIFTIPEPLIQPPVARRPIQEPQFVNPPLRDIENPEPEASPPPEEAATPTEEPTPSETATTETEEPTGEATEEPTAETPTETPAETAQAPASERTPSPEEQVSPAPSPEVNEQSELFAYSREGTSQSEAMSEYQQWIQTAIAWLGHGQDENLDELQNDIEQTEIVAVYPKEACVGKLEGTAVVGVLVNEDGRVVGDPAPRLIQSSGYGVFNRLAKSVVRDHQFEGGEKRAYQVRVKFVYNPEVCPTVPASSASPEESSSADV